MLNVSHSSEPFRFFIASLVIATAQSILLVQEAMSPTLVSIASARLAVCLLLGLRAPTTTRKLIGYGIL